MSRYSAGRRIANDIIKRDRRRRTYHKVQMEAKARPESVLVNTSEGAIWMSPIEFKLYEAMRREGLSPVPQCLIEGYIVDFAFPDVMLAIEADGAAYHGESRQERDRKRDWILSRKGWTVKRFYGTTIHNKAENCAFVVRHEVEDRRAKTRQTVAEGPLRRILDFLRLD